MTIFKNFYYNLSSENRVELYSSGNTLIYTIDNRHITGEAPKIIMQPQSFGFLHIEIGTISKKVLVK